MWQNGGRADRDENGMNVQNSGNRLQQLSEERIALEERLQQGGGAATQKSRSEIELAYDRLHRELLSLFRQASERDQRTEIILELVRILENRLVYIQNYIAEPTPDLRHLASRAGEFLESLMNEGEGRMSRLESSYYRAILSLHGGDLEKARRLFQEACESEESDEANDIKYKSYVILGNLSHEEQDFAAAKDMHHKSLEFSQSTNVSAQALAFKGLNSYALGDADEALQLFIQALALFDPEQPFYNSYFHRNALLFCGLIHYERRELDEAAQYYSRVLDAVDPESFDYFDAQARLGRIHFATGRFPEAAEAYETALAAPQVHENDYMLDTRYWLARTYLETGEEEKARTCLQSITSSPVAYARKDKAQELLDGLSGSARG